MEFRGLRPGVARADADEDVIRRRLGVVRCDLPISIIVEHAGVEKLEFRLVAGALRVLLPQALIGELGLRIVITPAQPGIGRRRVERPPVFLSVLAVIALRPAEAEDSLLENRVASVPERESKTEALLAVAETGQAVFAPAVGARVGVIEGKVAPGVAVGAVVLAHRAPGPVGDVGADEFPVAPGGCG